MDNVQPFRDRFASALVEKRTEAAMSQAALGKAVGVGQPSVSAWESAKALPEPVTMITIAALFDLDLTEL